MFITQKIFSIPRSKRFILVLSTFLAVCAVGLVSFAAQNTGTPYSAELSYTETSDHQGVIGSVVPASCESSPPTSHFAGDCQCGISAPAACSAPGCTKTISWNTNVAGGVNIWLNSSHLGSFGSNGNLNAAIPNGGATLSVRRADGTVLCSSFTSGYPAPTVALTSSHATVPYGTNPTLTWTTTNSAVCTASGAWSGPVSALGGSSPVAVSGLSNTYTVTCTGPGGTSAPASVTVAVMPPTVDLTVSSANVVYGNGVTLSWTSSNVSSCQATGDWTGAKALSGGPDSVTPANGSNTYTITCEGIGGVTASDTETVTMLPPDVTFWSDPGLIGPGQSSVLRWTVSGAANCTVPVPVLGWTDAVLTAAGMFGGNTTVSPAYAPTTVYQLSCTNPAAPTNRTATILQPSGSITATSCVIPYNGSSCNSTVAWNSNNFLGARSVLQDGVQFSTDVSNSVIRAITPENDTFRLSDTGSSFYREVTAGATCQVGSVWVSTISACIELPRITVDAEDVIRSGRSEDVEITVVAAYDANCVMDDGALHPFFHTAAPGPQTYPITSRILTATQIVTVTCSHTLYPEVSDSEEFRIQVIPTVQEI